MTDAQIETQLFANFATLQTVPPLTEAVIRLASERLRQLRSRDGALALRYARFLYAVAPPISADARLTAQWSLAATLATVGQASQALTHYQHIVARLQNSATHARLIDLQIDQISVLSKLARYQEAIALEQCIRQQLPQLGAQQPRYQMHLERVIATVYRELGDHATAATCLERGLALAEQQNDVASHGLLQIGMGVLDIVLDRLNVARRRFDHALAIFTEQDNVQEVARLQRLLGELAYHQSRHQHALRHLQASRDRFLQIGQPVEVAYVDSIRAMVYTYLWLVDQAQPLAESAEKVLKQHQRHYYRAENLINLAEVAHRQGNIAEIERRMQQARRIFKRLGSVPRVYQVDVRRGQLAAYTNRIATARRIAQRLANAIDPQQEAFLFVQNQFTLARVTGEEAHIIKAQQIVAEHNMQPLIVQCHHLRGKVQKSLRAAQPHFAQAVALIEQQRRKLSLDEIHIGFMEERLPIYRDYLHATHATGEPVTILHALNLSLTAPLAPLPVRGGGLSADEQSRLADLRQQWHRQHEGCALNPTDVPVQSLAEIEMEIEELLRKQRIQGLGEEGHELHELHEFSVAAAHLLARMQGVLSADTAQLHFYITDLQCHLLIVTADCCHHLPNLAPAKMVERLQKAWRLHMQHIAHKGSVAADVAHSITSRLDNLLFAPARHLLSADHLTLVLPPEWHDLPLAACFDGERCLIERHTLTYLTAPEAVLQRQTGEQSAAAALIVSFSDDDRLYHTKHEAQQVATALAATHTVRQLAEADATLAAFRAASAPNSLIHIAAHAVFRPDNPLFSWMRLADQRLTVSDLYDMHLTGQPFVVLSACETGRGQPRGGGVLGLGRAFLGAGASGLVYTQWAQGDASSADLVATFYHHWQPQKTATALQQAQIAMLQRGLHPFHWAGFAFVAG